MQPKLQLASALCGTILVLQCHTAASQMSRRGPQGRGNGDGSGGRPGDGDGDDTYPFPEPFPPFEVQVPAAGTQVPVSVQCGSTLSGCACDPNSCAKWDKSAPIFDEDLDCFQYNKTERSDGDCLWACPSGVANKCFPIPAAPNSTAQLCVNDTTAGVLILDTNNGLSCYSQDGSCSRENAIPIDFIPPEFRPTFAGPNVGACLVVNGDDFPDNGDDDDDDDGGILCSVLTSLRECNQEMDCFWQQGFCNSGINCRKVYGGDARICRSDEACRWAKNKSICVNRKVK